MPPALSLVRGQDKRRLPETVEQKGGGSEGGWARGSLGVAYWACGQGRLGATAISSAAMSAADLRAQGSRGNCRSGPRSAAGGMQLQMSSLPGGAIGLLSCGATGLRTSSTEASGEISKPRSFCSLQASNPWALQHAGHFPTGVWVCTEGCARDIVQLSAVVLVGTGCHWEAGWPFWLAAMRAAEDASI